METNSMKTEESKQVTEAKWLPRTLSGEAVDLVGMVSSKLGYDINAAMAFCVALLEDVNAHDEAAKVNEILSGMMGESKQIKTESFAERIEDQIRAVSPDELSSATGLEGKELERFRDVFVDYAVNSDIIFLDWKDALKMMLSDFQVSGADKIRTKILGKPEYESDSFGFSESVDKFGLPVLTEDKEVWHIVDWTGAVKFDGKKFSSFEDAEEFLMIQLGDSYETEREEFEIIPFKGTRDARYLEPNHPSGVTKYAIEAKSMDDMLPGVNLIFLGMGMDKNGNKIVKLSFPNSRGFSIQTSGNMPKTHKMKGEINAAVVAKEAAAYIKAHGSEEQKKKLKVG